MLRFRPQHMLQQQAVILTDTVTTITVRSYLGAAAAAQRMEISTGSLVLIRCAHAKAAVCG
jgi:hypothetical protein